MLTDPKYPGCFLLQAEDLRNGGNEVDGVSGKALAQIRDWVMRFLCRPHAQLGREGAVCPFTAPSMRKKLFWMTAYRGERIPLAEAQEVLMRYRDWFLELEPKAQPDANLKTILILFPDMTTEQAPDVVDRLQHELKPDFVERGLMIGQFHPECPEGGLWNPDFRPLQSPVPLLAIRNMVASDKAFLRHDKNLMDRYSRRFPALAGAAA